MKAIMIYTEAYSPFIFGGDVRRPIACKTKAYMGPYKLGKGFEGYLLQVNGKSYIAEKTTGALVGPSLEAVMKDIKTGKKSVMKEQVKQAKQRAAYAKIINEAEFWRRIK